MSDKKKNVPPAPKKRTAFVIELGDVSSESQNPTVLVTIDQPDSEETEPKLRPVLEAVLYGKLETLKKLLATSPSDVKLVFGPLRVTLLHLAAYHQPHLVSTLIKNGANATALDTVGRSAFHLACTAASSPECIKALIDAGSDVNQKIMLPMQMWTPNTAVRHNHGENKKWHMRSNHVSTEKKRLVPQNKNDQNDILGVKYPRSGIGSELPVPDCLGRTGLHQTVKAASPDCVKILLAAGAIVDVKDQKGLTPLLLAGAGVSPDDLDSLIRYEAVVRMLVDAGADVNILNPDTGTSALHHAAARCSLSATKLLVEHGAMVDKISATGATAIHEAAHSGALQVLQFLLDINEGLGLVNKQDHVGQTPLHKAAFSGNRGCLEILMRKGGHLSLLTHSGTSVLDATFMHIARPYHFLAAILDNCLQTNNVSVLDRAFKVYLDFSILAPHGCDRQTSILREIFNSPKGPGHSILLRHPLLETFLWLKWQKLRIFFFFILFVYGSYMVSLSVFVLAEGEEELRFLVPYARHILITTSCMLLLHIIIQFFLRPWFYIREFETWNFAFCGGASIIVAVCNEQLKEFQVHMTSVVLLLAWTELLLLIGRFPTWGNYALMFYTVLRNVMKVMLTFVFIVLGYTLSFYVQFNKQESFDGPFKAFVKTVVMMAGEFDYKDLFEMDNNHSLSSSGKALHKDPLDVISRLIFLTFVILTTIVMMNLMVGLAVSDIQAVQTEGHFRRLLKQAQFVDHLETIISHSILTKMLPKCLVRFLVQRRRVVTELVLQPSAVERKSRYPKKLPRRLIEACVELAVRQKAISQLKCDEEIMSTGKESRFVWLDGSCDGSQSDLFGVQQQATLEDMMMRMYEELQDMKNLIQTSAVRPTFPKNRTLSIKESRRLNPHVRSSANSRASRLEDVVCEVQGAQCMLQRLKEN
ncbi:transient receptor potential channel pyrexia-like [Neocloeon triangulifer]|uniref:transient receptor potential channel pyrexia-like n=1 Tax=Neocloeon triangulifer TaxID=2078957 RepID=UPI00286F69A3|nr:transient receptor potential channel pyrexia-like [Neocloeon triangulifer]XP_059486324.1 transient receptor potential channel pyrexia-like [Neocloeon triangulifer]